MFSGKFHRFIDDGVIRHIHEEELVDAEVKNDSCLLLCLFRKRLPLFFKKSSAADGAVDCFRDESGVFFVRLHFPHQ